MITVEEKNFVDAYKKASYHRFMRLNASLISVKS